MARAGSTAPQRAAGAGAACGQPRRTAGGPALQVAEGRGLVARAEQERPVGMLPGAGEQERAQVLRLRIGHGSSVGSITVSTAPASTWVPTATSRERTIPAAGAT